MRYLYELIRKSVKPVVVAGDFNTFWGEHEIYLFMQASGLRSANTEGKPSYPSRNPRRELDFILYSDGIEITNFSVPQVQFSDHLPLVCDLRVVARVAPRTETDGSRIVATAI
jgi:endonuclease/exonuclease/phosphatase family metal-dependent hydrolase